MNILETLGLLHLIFYSCAGLVWVVKNVITGLQYEEKKPKLAKLDVYHTN